MTDHATLPPQGRPREEVLAALQAFAADDPDYKSGRLWSLVYWLDEAHDDFLGGWTAFELEWLSLTPQSLERVSRTLIERSVTLVPTLALHEAFSRLADADLLRDPALGDMLRVFGSRQIRNRATMGGNIVTASPIGDSAPVLMALDAEVVLVSLNGERRLPIDQFFVAYRKTALQPGEILKTIIVPRGASQPELTRKNWWCKVSRRREMDISTVAACFTVDLDKRKVVRHARLAYGGVAAMPGRAKCTCGSQARRPRIRASTASIRRSGRS